MLTLQRQQLALQSPMHCKSAVHLSRFPSLCTHSIEDHIVSSVIFCCRGGALVAIDTGFMGPNYSISTACATANYAFVAAANHIRRGEADVILVGGSEAPIIPVGLGGFVACRCAVSSRSRRLNC